MKTDRREFLKYGLITSTIFYGGIFGVKQFKKYRKHTINYTGQWVNQSDRGHQLRDAFKQTTTSSLEIPTLIVGGGMTGLLTGYYLKQAGFNNFKILEMNSNAGGNSAYGQNEVSKFPWGAHYIPLPNTENKQLLEFFKDMGLASNKSPGGGLEFNEEYLCQDPQERLFIKGEWQESILPMKGIMKGDEDQLKRFHDLVYDYKFKKGNDGKYAFTIPLMESSQDPQFLKLDQISFADFLKDQGFTSEVVTWYMNYCTLDDYGMGIDTASAWSGLHYFCSRRPNGQYDDHQIMTWPEGNGWVLQKLTEYLKDHIQTNCAVMKIRPEGDGVIKSHVFNFETKELAECKSKYLIFSSPQFLAPYLFEDGKNLPNVTSDDYYSWLIANVTVKLKPEEFQNLHWDNVRYQSSSLGYIHARHQELRGSFDGTTVLTLYWPLYDKNLTATEIRKKVSELGWKQWAPRVESELEAMHPGISSLIQSMDIKIYGHAMIGPRVGRIKSVFTQSWKSQAKHGIYFAHTDNSGMSLFEEAHYWGHRVAQEILKHG
tara:strand:+ start:73815 stop:75443 length:1629 start_codon:yes stop_codon:yes gene_type:complete